MLSSAFTLDLSPHLTPVSLPRRSISLSLFLVLTAVAESMQHARGSPRVETRMSGGGVGVEVRVEASSSPAAGSPAGELSPRRFDLDHSALDTARRLLRSIGGRMAVLRKSGRGISCLISLPLRAAQHPEERGVPRRQRSSQAAATPRTGTPPPFGGLP